MMERQSMQTIRVSRRHFLMKFAYAPAVVAIAVPLVAMKQRATSQDNWRWCHKCEGYGLQGMQRMESALLTETRMFLMAAAIISCSATLILQPQARRIGDGAISAKDCGLRDTRPMEFALLTQTSILYEEAATTSFHLTSQLGRGIGVGAINVKHSGLQGMQHMGSALLTALNIRVKAAEAMY